MVKLLLLVSPSTSTECSLSRLFLSISLYLLKLGFHLSLPLLFMDLKVTAIDVLICSRYVFSSILFWGGGTVYFCCRSVFFLGLLWLAELCWYQYCDSLFSWEVESVWERAVGHLASQWLFFFVEGEFHCVHWQLAQWSITWFRKFFSNFGKIVEAFIPFKRSKGTGNLIVKRARYDRGSNYDIVAVSN